MNRSPKAHLISGILIFAGVLLTHRSSILLTVCTVLSFYLLAIGKSLSLRRSMVAFVPIAIMILAVHVVLSHIATATQIHSPLLTIMRLASLIVTFNYVVTFFQSEDSAERLAAAGLKNEWLVIALSAITTMPLMKDIAVRITEARFAAGLIPGRSPLSTASQLPHILRPLFTEALRIAIARSDTWNQRCLMPRLSLNLQINQTRQSIQIRDWMAILVPSAWLILITTIEYL
jgi:hypothetical protein